MDVRPLSQADRAVFSPRGTAPPRRARLKRWGFRLAAIFVVPLLLLGVLELALRLAGYGYPTSFFVAKTLNGQRVLCENAQFGWRFFPRTMARTPRPVVLPARKPPETRRIFVLGESAAFGDPSPAFGLPRVLEALLRHRHPNTRYEVVNVAMTAINSNVILPIAEDCAEQDGDVWVLYIGNNEVVGPYGGGTVFGAQVPPLPLIRASIALKATKTGQMLDDLLQWATRAQPRPDATVSMELFLDQPLRQDDPRMERVYAHFARNLADIIRAGARSGAKVVVSTIAVNLKDCAPFGSRHRPTLGTGEAAAWEEFYQAGVRAQATNNLTAALAAFQQAARIDGSHAELRYRTAQVLWQTGQFAAARDKFAHARDWDTLRFRADRRINEIIRQTAANRLAEGIALVDGEAILARHSPQQTPGAELLYEHVHLNFSGNYRLARALAEQIDALLPATTAPGPTAEWASEAECARQLGLNDWERYETLNLLCRRLANPPFTRQFNHAAQYEQLKQETAHCRAALTPAALSNALHQARQAVAQHPEDWVLRQNLARLLARGADHAGAAAEWEKVIAAVPHYPEARCEFGWLLVQAGRPAEAAAQLAEALRLRPHFPEALRALGRALSAQNRWAEAVRHFEQALRWKPQDPDALADLGKALNQLGRGEEAKARLAEALRLDPGHLEAGLSLGQTLNQSGDLSEALRRYSEQLRANPQDAVAHCHLGRVHRKLGHHAEAESHFAKAVLLRPDFAEAHCELGFELALKGDAAAAISHFTAAIQLKPDLAIAHLNLGVALAKQRQYAEAIKRFEEVLRLEPGHADARAYLEAARRAQGK